MSNSVSGIGIRVSANPMACPSVSGLEGGEERDHAGVVLPPPLHRPVDDLLEYQAQALAGMAEGIEPAGLDQRLDGPLVEHLGVDPLAEVVEVDDRGPFASRSSTIRATSASPTLRTAARPKVMAPGAAALLAGSPALAAPEVGGEVGERAVDVGDECLDPERPALAEIDRRLVLVVLDVVRRLARYSTG